MIAPEPTISQALAELMGLVSITTPFIPCETWILHNILADLRRGDIPCAAVETPCGVEVWRASSGMRFAHENPCTP